MRRAARRDQNEAEIIAALQKAGAWVHQLDVPCDLLVFHRRTWHLLEVKAPTGRLTPLQRAFINAVGVDAVHVVRTPEEALKALGCR